MAEFEWAEIKRLVDLLDWALNRTDIYESKKAREARDILADWQVRLNAGRVKKKSREIKTGTGKVRRPCEHKTWFFGPEEKLCMSCGKNMEGYDEMGQ